MLHPLTKRCWINKPLRYTASCDPEVLCYSLFVVPGTKCLHCLISLSNKMFHIPSFPAFGSLCPSLECVHAGVASSKLVNFLQSTLWQKARGQSRKHYMLKNGLESKHSSLIGLHKALTSYHRGAGSYNNKKLVK